MELTAWRTALPGEDVNWDCQEPVIGRLLSLHNSSFPLVTCSVSANCYRVVRFVFMMFLTQGSSGKIWRSLMLIPFRNDFPLWDVSSPYKTTAVLCTTIPASERGWKFSIGNQISMNNEDVSFYYDCYENWMIHKNLF